MITLLFGKYGLSYVGMLQLCEKLYRHLGLKKHAVCVHNVSSALKTNIKMCDPTSQCVVDLSSYQKLRKLRI